MERLAALKLASEAAARPGTGRWLAARTGIGLACGVAAGAVLQPFGLPMWLPAAPALALVFAAVGARRLPWTAGLAGWLWLAAAATAGAQLGYVRMAAASARADAASQLLAALGGWQQIRGLVADDPAPTRRTSRLILSDVLVRTPHGWRGLPAKVAVFVPPYPEHEYGEYLQLRGKLQPLPPSEASAAMQRQDVRAEMA
ncbi:MAG: DUF4131 domain-containing protein, partial [Chloroflexota bacterium]|nr:DUF4131 domain-containing protein [Chloroflexota bacterium]